MSKILLPLDGSPLAEQAIPHAVAQLKAGDELVLLRILEPHYPVLGDTPGPVLTQPMLYVSLEEAAAYLAEKARPLRESGLSVTERVLVGVPREEIASVARQLEADLIVMTSHGFSGGKRWLLGSVAEAVARESPCPVWLLRCQQLDDAPPAPKISRVVIALDTSPLSERGLDFAVDWLRAHPASQVAPELVLYSATGLARQEDGGWSPGPEVRREMLASAQHYLQELAKTLTQRGWKARTVIEDGPAAPGILDAAEREQADLVVLGSHGRTGLDRWFWGSVAEQVARHATCPVLLVNSLVPVSPVAA